MLISYKKHNLKNMEFSHIDKNNQPKMVDVGGKKSSKRKATAIAVMKAGEEIISLLEDNDFKTKKGPVFQTAIIAGIQAVKKTAELIPMCHPLMIDGVDLSIAVKDSVHIEILCTVKIEGKTGVEMEALTGATVADLTVYDMCKSISQNITIKEVKLLEKTGGKSDVKTAR